MKTDIDPYFNPKDENGDPIYYGIDDPRNPNNLNRNCGGIPMRTDVPTPRIPKPRGGRRPGAGAPKNNINAYRTGRHSKRLFRAALMIAAVPDLQILFQVMQKRKGEADQARFRKIFKAAFEVAALDTTLAEEMENLVYKRLAEHLHRAGVTKSDLNSIKQSTIASLNRVPAEVYRASSRPFRSF